MNFSEKMFENILKPRFPSAVIFPSSTVFEIWSYFLLRIPSQPTHEHGISNLYHHPFNESSNLRWKLDTDEAVELPKGNLMLHI